LGHITSAGPAIQLATHKPEKTIIYVIHAQPFWKNGQFITKMFEFNKYFLT
jgi:hypothetical protein